MPIRDRPIAADRASPLWTATAAFAALLALVVGGWAVFDQYQASRPVGEGELFLHEVSDAAEIYSNMTASGTTPDLTVRSIRNDLDVEALRLDPDGSFMEHIDQSSRSRGRGVARWGYRGRRLCRNAQPITQPVQ